MRNLGYAVLAFCIAGFTYFIDVYRTQMYKAEHALLWARQVSQQVERLTWVARDIQKPDPVEWATQQLSSESEPGVIKVFPARLPAAEELYGPGRELFDLKLEKGEFDYAKEILPADGLGVRIQISTGYTGFLGTHSRGASDFTFLFFFTAILVAFLWISKARSGKRLAVVVPQRETTPDVFVAGLGQKLKLVLLDTKEILSALNDSRDSLRKSFEEMEEVSKTDLEEAYKSFEKGIAAGQNMSCHVLETKKLFAEHVSNTREVDKKAA